MKLMIVNRTLGDPLCDAPDTVIATDSSIVLPKNPYFVPDNGHKYILEAAPAFKINRLGKTIGQRFSHRYYDAITIVLRAMPVIDGKPMRNGSAIYTACDAAVVRGEWIENFSRDNLTFALADKSVTVSFDDLKIDETLAMLSNSFSLKMGDIISPCALPLSTEPEIGSRVEARINDIQTINLKIR